MTICAWRLRRRPDGVQIRAAVLRTPNWAAMRRWLERTRVSRRLAPPTLWIEDADRPAVLTVRVTR